MENLKDTVVNVVQALTDDALTFIIAVPAVFMAVNQIALPDWYIASVGIVIAYYFKK